MRIVSDILSIGGAPVAFNEVVYGTYQGICPWCAENLAIVRAKTFGELYERLFDLTSDHMSVCASRKSTTMQVEIRKGPNAN